MECLSYCVANHIDLARLDAHYKAQYPDFLSVKSRDVLKLVPSSGERKLVFIFKNGTVVSWGVKRYQVDAYLETIMKFCEKPFAKCVHDEFSFHIADKTAIEPHDYFDVDCLSVDRDMDTDELRLSLSYGFSQSIKLYHFEMMLEGLIDRHTPLIRALAKKRFTIVSRKQIREIIGEIIGAKSEMNLISNFLYHPKYFWQHPTLEEHYIMLERYLHIQRRVNALNHRLDTLNEIFDMLNHYLENRHAHTLEIIIIVLIAIEIIFGVWNFHV